MSTLLEDKEAIRDVLAEYCFCIDRRDADGYAALFTEDCVWDAGAWGRREGRQAMREFVAATAARGSKLRHLNANTLISVSGETATACCYLLILSLSPDKPPAVFFSGFCDDELVKQGGRWLIRSRRVRAE